MDTFRSLPWPIQLAAVCLVAAIGIVLVVLAIEPWGRRRARTTDQRQRQQLRAREERRELRNAKRPPSAPKRDAHDARTDTHVTPMTAHVTDGTSRTDPADKPPYQQADTADLVAVPRKLPGQDRLTRDPRTGMEVAPEWAIDHLSGGGSPSQRPDPAVPAEAPPPLRSSDPSLARAEDHPATTQMPLVRPPVPQPETRAQRRARLEALIHQDAAQRDRPESP